MPGRDDDHPLAAELAEQAGQLLLARRRPGGAVLSEEGTDGKDRLSADRVWIVDPLDGTREFGEDGRVDWAVHVALWSRADGLTAGALALPAQGKLLATTGPRPAPPPAPPGPGSPRRVRSGSFCEWDAAAPAAVARAHGCHVSRINGSPVRFNQPDPWLQDILVRRPEIAGPMLNAIRETTHAI